MPRQEIVGTEALQITENDPPTAWWLGGSLLDLGYPAIARAFPMISRLLFLTGGISNRHSGWKLPL